MCPKIILVFTEGDKITARELRLTTSNFSWNRGEERRVEAKLCGLVWMLCSWQPAIIQFQGNVSNASKTESCCSPQFTKTQSFLSFDQSPADSEVSQWTPSLSSHSFCPEVWNKGGSGSEQSDLRSAWSHSCHLMRLCSVQQRQILNPVYKVLDGCGNCSQHIKQLNWAS